MNTEVPEGFGPSARTDPYLDMIGPIYSEIGEGGMLLGPRARTKHCNGRGRVHGAVLAALLDTVCGWSCSGAGWDARAHGHPEHRLLVGTRGGGGFAGRFLGSVSQAILYHAAHPVAVVPDGSGPSISG